MINKDSILLCYIIFLIEIVTIIFLDQGDVFGWGNSEYGQLLLDSDKYQVNTPRKLVLNKAMGKIIDIGATGSSCIALNSN